MEKPASGIILADKPEGISSQLLVSRFKRIYGTKSAGHTGTLDPIATGLNLICFGRATKVCEYITGCDKAYIACMQLGLETDTGDTTGTATAESSVRCTAADVASILPRFTGELDQIPPVYSAIKVGGRKLYELARAGKAPEPEPRHVTIYALELLEAWGLRPAELKKQLEKQHIFTHITWQLRCYYVEVSAPDGGLTWVDAARFDRDISLPTAFRQFWETP